MIVTIASLRIGQYLWTTDYGHGWMRVTVEEIHDHHECIGVSYPSWLLRWAGSDRVEGTETWRDTPPDGDLPTDETLA
jgi:hypothetical protein